MINPKKITFLLLGICSAVFTSGQKKTGEIFSREQLIGIDSSKMPEEKTLLPDSVSLKMFCPKVADQEGGTCFAYSSAYAGRTILYNATLNTTTINDESTFSPGYIVRILQPRGRLKNRKCSKGASTIEACKVMKKEGVVPLRSFMEECSFKDISDDLKREAGKYKINIKSLFESCDPPLTKIYQIQQALSNKHPVVIGLKTMRSFNRKNNQATPDLWEPKASEKANADCNKATHAICIVGYNNNKYGGSFEILNSWGEDWKNNGFTYVKYSDLAIFLAFAIELSN